MGIVRWTHSQLAIKSELRKKVIMGNVLGAVLGLLITIQPIAGNVQRDVLGQEAFVTNRQPLEVFQTDCWLDASSVPIDFVLCPLDGHGVEYVGTIEVGYEPEHR